jgi:hypothetical protein
MHPCASRSAPTSVAPGSLRFGGLPQPGITLSRSARATTNLLVLAIMRTAYGTVIAYSRKMEGKAKLVPLLFVTSFQHFQPHPGGNPGAAARHGVDFILKRARSKVAVLIPMASYRLKIIGRARPIIRKPIAHTLPADIHQSVFKIISPQGAPKWVGLIFYEISSYYPSFAEFPVRSRHWPGISSGLNPRR